MRAPDLEAAISGGEDEARRRLWPQLLRRLNRTYKGDTNEAADTQLYRAVTDLVRDNPANFPKGWTATQVINEGDRRGWIMYARCLVCCAVPPEATDEST